MSLFRRIDTSGANDDDTTTKETFWTKRNIIIAAVSGGVLLLILIIVLATTIPGDKSNSSGGDAGSGGGSSGGEGGGGGEKDPSGYGRKFAVGGWYWRYHDCTDKEAVDFLKAKGWDYVLYSTTPYDAECTNTVRALNEAGIRVYAMCAESLAVEDYTTKEAIAKWKTEITDIVEWAKAEDLTLAGINIDLEPHGSDEWATASWSVKSDMFAQWLACVTELRAHVKSFGMEFSAAVAWWYSFQEDQGNLVGGHKVRDVFDMVYPMCYDGAGPTAAKILQNGQYYMRDGLATRIGIAVEDHGDALETVMEDVYAGLGSNVTDYFHGFAIYHSKAYPDWPGNH